MAEAEATQAMRVADMARRAVNFTAAIFAGVALAIIMAAVGITAAGIMMATVAPGLRLRPAS
jgi:hypothetical protein